MKKKTSMKQNSILLKFLCLIIKNLLGGMPSISWKRNWKCKKALNIQELWRILKPHIALLLLSGKSFEICLWSLLTLSKQPQQSNDVPGKLTLSYFSKVLMGCSMLPILSHGCPCPNVKSLQEPWVGLSVSVYKREHFSTTKVGWLILDPQKAGFTSIIF